jgi:hypothetical protein
MTIWHCSSPRRAVSLYPHQPLHYHLSLYGSRVWVMHQFTLVMRGCWQRWVDILEWGGMNRNPCWEMTGCCSLLICFRGSWGVASHHRLPFRTGFAMKKNSSFISDAGFLKLLVRYYVTLACLWLHHMVWWAFCSCHPSHQIPFASSQQSSNCLRSGIGIFASSFCSSFLV